MRILVAEDDPSLTQAVVFALRTLNSYAVDCVRGGDEVLQALESEPYDLLILDVGLPGLDGFEVLKRLRARRLDLPVLIMSGRDSADDKVKGLDMGADDYLAKPFAVRELEARVGALLRRSTGNVTSGQSSGELAFDPETRTISLDGEVIALSVREVAILSLLLKELGRVVTKDQLIGNIYTADEAPGPNAIEVFVHRLRKKLAISPYEIRTHHGIGYQLYVR